MSRPGACPADGPCCSRRPREPAVPHRLRCWTSRPAIGKSSSAREQPRGTSKAVTSCTWPTESCRPCLSISRRGRSPAHRCRCFSNSRCSAACPPVLDVAANGTLVYARGSGTSRLPVWVDRDGRETSIKAPTAMYQTPRLSPDGRRLAFFDISSSGEYDVWILDLERGTVDRLTTDQGRDSEPIWSPDSTRIAYHSGAQPGGPGIFIRRADGAGSVERLTTGTHLPVDWSADGKWIAYADFGDRGISIATVIGLMRVDIEGDHTPRVLIKGGSGRVSPTENWVATTSPTTGTDEIYVLPFTDTLVGARAFPPTAATTRHGRPTARRCSIVADRR